MKYHKPLYPHYKKAKKLHKAQPKHPFGLSIDEHPEVINYRYEKRQWEIDTNFFDESEARMLIDIDRMWD